jgi:hypothetical protein
MEHLAIIRNAVSYANVQELAAAFAKFKVSSKEHQDQQKLVFMVNDVMYLRVPDVSQKSKDVKDALAQYIYFASTILCTPSEKIKIFMDKEVGDMCHLPIKTLNGLKELVGSAKTLTGLVGGRTSKFDSGFKGPINSLVVAIRTINKYGYQYKKLTPKPTNLQILKNSVDTQLGLNDPGVTPFTTNFVRQTLALACSPDGRLPPSYFAVTKSENNVSSTEGIMAKLGYVTVNPSCNKVIDVCSQNYKHGDAGVITDVYTEKECSLAHDKLFHAGVKLLLPYLQQTSDSQKVQLGKSNSDLSIASRDLYKKHGKLVDEVNRSYAFLSAFRRKGSKGKITKASSVLGAIVKASNSSDSMPFQNKKGSIFPTYMDIPVVHRHFLEKLLKRRASPAKRKVEFSDSPNKAPNPKGKGRSSSTKRAKKTTTDSQENMVVDSTKGC